MNRGLLRREMRREAFAFIRENPDWTRQELDEHLIEEFGGVQGIDPATLMLLIQLVMKLIEALFNRTD